MARTNLEAAKARLAEAIQHAPLPWTHETGAMGTEVPDSILDATGEVICEVGTGGMGYWYVAQAVTYSLSDLARALRVVEATQEFLHTLPGTIDHQDARKKLDKALRWWESEEAPGNG